MSVTVRVPTPLRNLTDNQAAVTAEGSTVQEVIDDLERRHPGIRERLVDESGELRRFVNVFVDDEDVRFQQGLPTAVRDGATVSIVPAVAGGSRARPVAGGPRSTELAETRDALALSRYDVGCRGAREG